MEGKEETGLGKQIDICFSFGIKFSCFLLKTSVGNRDAMARHVDMHM